MADLAGEKPFCVPTISVEKARRTPGLRLVVQTTVPNPWSEAAKAITYLKRLPHHRVARLSRFKAAEGGNDALREWTGMDCAPIAMWENDPPRDHWARILHLCERLAPEPRLIPADPTERAEMFGLCHEICDEDGFGWNRRLLFLQASEPDTVSDLERKYGAGGGTEQALKRISDILGVLSDKLQAQAAKGRSFFVGDAVSAADIYWASFSFLLEPPAPDLCPLEDHVRQFYTLDTTRLSRSVDPLLLTHRDRILRGWFQLPIQV